MSPRPLLAAVAAAVLLPVTLAAPADAAGATVTVQGMAFAPGSVTVPLGGTVTWRFADDVAHTSTSDQGFWDSGAHPNGTTYARAFGSAGTFAYHCAIHPEMHGRVAVRPTASGSPARGYRLVWSKGAGSGGVTFDVQTRLGSGRWASLKAGTTGASASFNPARAGTYSVRARTDKGGKRSSWSPTVTVTIS